jgi:hypothetical protein
MPNKLKQVINKLKKPTFSLPQMLATIAYVSLVYVFEDQLQVPLIRLIAFFFYFLILNLFNPKK